MRRYRRCSWTGILILFWCSVCVGDVRTLEAKELEEVDLKKNRLLEKWAQASNEDRSEIIVLSGMYEDAHTSLLHVLGTWNQGYLSDERNLLVIDGNEAVRRGALGATSEITAWLKSRQVGNKIAWSVVLVQDADSLEDFDLNEIFQLFWRKSECLDANSGLHCECANVLIVLATKFGQRVAAESLLVEIDDSEDAQGRHFRVIESAAHREMRIRWSGVADQRYRGLGTLLKNMRQIVYPMTGSRMPGEIHTIVSQQQKMRAERVNKIKSTKRSQLEDEDCMDIDVDVFEAAGFIGQEHVIAQVKTVLEGVKHGLKTSSSPLVFLFAGSAGLGKTMLAQLIARAYHCGKDLNTLYSQRKFLQVDMVNYKTERDVDGFVDPSPGLQGTGVLSGVFREESRPVILLDEIEKSHPTFLQHMLLPMLNEDGRVQLKKTGEHFPTKDAVFILTTNCFDDVFSKQVMETPDATSYDAILASFASTMRNGSNVCKSALSGSNPFSAETLWRRLVQGHSLANQHGVLVFLPPSKAHIEALVSGSLESMNRNLERHEIYYSKNTLVRLQRRMIQEFEHQKQTMSTIKSFVESSVSRALAAIPPVNPGEVKHVMISLDSTSGDIRAQDLALHQDTCTQQNHRQQYLSQQQEERGKRRMTETGRVTSGRSKSSGGGGGGEGKSKDAVEEALDIDVLKAQDEMKQNDEDSELSLLFSVVLAVSLLLFFVLDTSISVAFAPLIALAFLVGCVVALLYWYFPGLMRALVQLISILYNYFGKWTFPILFIIWALVRLSFRCLWKNVASRTSNRAIDTSNRVIDTSKSAIDTSKSALATSRGPRKRARSY